MPPYHIPRSRCMIPTAGYWKPILMQYSRYDCSAPKTASPYEAALVCSTASSEPIYFSLQSSHVAREDESKLRESYRGRRHRFAPWTDLCGAE